MKLFAKREARKLRKTLGASIALALACALAPIAAFGATELSVETDPATSDELGVMMQDSTLREGFVWTDKSVFESDATVAGLDGDTLTVDIGDSNFLVALSAKSSTASIDGVISRPLDIVLVLDVSGSMDQMLSYAPIYAADMSTNGEYYVKQANEDSYRTLRYSRQNQSWYYSRNNNPVYITPKTSATDTDSSHVQVYQEISKLEALKSAVNGFVAYTADQNASVVDPNKQHRIALVKFSGNKSSTVGNNTYMSGGYSYNYSQPVKGFTAVDSVGESALTSAVNSLVAAGATRSDNGMSVASDLLDDARDGAQKVVIFFTDGEPTTLSDWSADVANSAIGHAKTMKDDGAVIYSIGVFSGADPDAENPNDFNRYMHAVSSNYPKATGYTTNTMGARAAGSDYYSAVDNADALNVLFQELASSITSLAARIPTHVDEGFDSHSGGYVTFVDQLGSYMKVDSILSVAYQGVVYENQATGPDANGDEYANTSQVQNQLGEQVVMSSVIVTVERSGDPSVGDVVTVKVPAALIPLSHYDVDVAEDGKVTATSELACPIRVFYGVSLKDEVDGLLADPDAAMSSYIESNTVSGGVAFYSNAFDAEENAMAGSTYASFAPATSNRFYFLAENEPLFLDGACTNPATALSESSTYYYQRFYYKVGSEEAQVETVAVAGSAISASYVGRDANNQIYLKSGSPRVSTALYGLSANKDSNPTETASTYGVAAWENPGVGNAVANYLGNNGRLLVGLPGALTVTKNVVVPAAYAGRVDVAAQSFPFVLSLEDGSGAALTGSFVAKVFDASGNQVGSNLTVSDGSTFTLKNGQTLKVYNLPANAIYEVEEKAFSGAVMPAGFTQTAATETLGFIASGKVSSATFVNTYKPESVTLSGAANLDGKKIFSGRVWKNTDEFGFILVPETSSAPMPAQNIIVLNGSDAQLNADGTYSAEFSFGDIVFTEPGTYTYSIYETLRAANGSSYLARVPGVTYSQADYEVVVVVTDNGVGKLSAEATMTCLADDAGVAPSVATVTSAVFENTFDEDEVSYTLRGNKVINDLMGDFELKSGMFSFELRPTGSNAAAAPMPSAATGTGADRVFVAHNEGDSIHFGPMATHLTKAEIEAAGGSVTYTYAVSEVIPSAANAVPGITYDRSTFDIKVVITWSDADGIVFEIVYPTTEPRVVFTNTYDLEEAVLKGDTALRGVKTLVGREPVEGDKFTFLLAAADDATNEAVLSGVVELPRPNGAVLDELPSGKGNFSFGAVTFNAKGVYRLAISEVVPTDTNGLTYDRHVAVATVTVVDGGNGKLEASVVYDNSTASTSADRVVTDAAAFTNVYAADALTYEAAGALTVIKTLDGADMTEGQFEFTIAAASADSPAVPAADVRFANGAHADGETCSMPNKLGALTFTQADAGKTYVYTVREDVEGLVDDNAAVAGLQNAGFTYDQSVYEVAIKVVDNGNGTLSTITAVTKVVDRMGEAIAAADRAPVVYASTEGAVPEVGFVNGYQYSNVTVDTDPTQTTVLFTKTLLGRNWADGETFDFEMRAAAANPSAPMPAAAVSGVVAAEVGKPAEGNVAAFGFGSITFTEPGTYLYEVVEVPGSDTTLSYAGNTAKLKVVVVDNGAGALTASVTVTDGNFTNTFATSVPYAAVGGLAVTKTLHGRDMMTGQFGFSVVPADVDTMHKMGFETLEGMNFYNAAGSDGQTITMLSPDNLTFTQEDIGKTYVLEFSEIAGDVTGYTYDSYTYRVSIAISLNASNELVITTTLEKLSEGSVVETTSTARTASSYDANADGYAAVVPFVNYYDAGESSALVEATKTMTGRTLMEAEFEFVIAYAADASKTALVTGTNTAAAEESGVATGKVIFDPLAYTLEVLQEAVTNGYGSKTSVSGKDVYTLNYMAYENTGDGYGVTYADSAFAFAVEVTDDGAGNLSTVVKYPADGIAFANTYSTGDPIDYSVKGLKVLDVPEGLSPASITGLFSFTIASETEGAPLPAEGARTVVNDAYGNVLFDDLVFTQELLEGVTPDADGVRTKDFIYTITESGSAAGVTNDAQTVKTFTLRLVDDGRGGAHVMWVTGDPSEGFMFEFVNSYGVSEKSSSVTDQIAISKTLTGRTIEADEFEFELVENDVVVVSAKNAADGSVTFPAVTYAKPGVHVYQVREVIDNVEGVTCDATVYTVTTTVVDNGDGTLGVAHELAGGATSVEFVNVYKADPATATLGASKLLDGRTLEADEFSFELKAVTGNAPLPAEMVVKNAADGSVTFGAITFDAVGEYTYSLSEVAGSAEYVTYDTASYMVVVKVTDSGKGYLSAEVEYPGGTPVFKNVYQEPEPEPTPTPDPDPDPTPDPSLSDTGDATPTVLLIAMAAAAAVLMVLALRRKAATRR